MKIEKMTEARLKKLNGKYIKFQMKLGSQYAIKSESLEGNIEVDTETWNLNRGGAIKSYTHYGFWLNYNVNGKPKARWISATELKLMFDIDVEE